MCAEFVRQSGLVLIVAGAAAYSLYLAGAAAYSLYLSITDNLFRNYNCNTTTCVSM